MITAVLATAVAFVITSAPASAATRIGWYDFERVDASGQVLSAPTYAPSSEDRIKLLVEPQKAPLGKVEIVLKSDSTITWRKGIQVDGKSCHSTWFGPVCTYPLLTQLYTEGTDHGGDPHAVDAAAAHRLRFGKAKLFGAYTDMYELPMTGAPSRFERARYTFTWVKD